MQIRLEENTDIIQALLSTDSIGYAMGQYEDCPYEVHEIGTSYHFIVSNNDKDIGIIIVDPTSYNNIFHIHVGFIKSARGFLTFAGGTLFMQFIKSILPQACLLGMAPATKKGALSLSEKLGFKLMAIVPSAIEIGNKKNNDLQMVDMAIMAINW